MRMAKFKTQHELKRILSMILAMCFVIMTVITDTSMTAQAAVNTWSFSYTGGIQQFTAPETGTYTIDAYGASGGGCSDKGGYWIGTKGGYGGHAAGSVTLVKGQTIYIAVGGQGSMSSSSASAAGGYNGGGTGYYGAGSGGGATSITFDNLGTLSAFKNKKDSVLLVAGGGGGTGTLDFSGSQTGNGGGLNGTGAAGVKNEHSNGGTQTAGYAFGQGQDSNKTATVSQHTNVQVYGKLGYGGAGGGGYYGGTYGNAGYIGGGGGSGYIASKLSGASTGLSNHIGNGSCKITYEGNPSYTLTIDVKDGGTLAKTTYSGTYGTTISLPTPNCYSGYTFVEYEKSNETLLGTLNGMKYTFGFGDDTIKAVYSADLAVEAKYNSLLYNGEGGILVNISQNDSIEKTFQLQLSYDGVNYSNISSDSITQIEGGTTTNFYYSGGIQSYTAPVSGFYQLKAVGAEGGTKLWKYYLVTSGAYPGNWFNGQPTNEGRAGGTSTGYIYLNAGETIYICVGGHGQPGEWIDNRTTGGNPGAGGYNGGGSGGGGKVYDGYGSPGSTAPGGGGATSITKTNRGVLSNFASYQSEVIMVAGGSGGVSGNSAAGAGGGTGENSSTGGGRVNGGTFGRGANGANAPYRNQAGVYSIGAGGGGGWIGGGAGVTGPSVNGAGAGGSGYIGGTLSSMPRSTVNGGASTYNKYNNADGSKDDANGFASVTFATQTLNPNVSHTIKATDKAAPDTPSNLQIIDRTNNQFVISFEDTGDNGTDYYVRANSYSQKTGALLKTSKGYNINVTAGVAKYLYVLDTNKNTKVTTANGKGTTDTKITIAQDGSVLRYLHIATIDKVGNISGTATIAIPNTTTYTVNHYLEQLDGSYKFKEADTLTAALGSSVTPATKNYDGFTAPALQTMTVDPLGLTVIDYYYTRNSYTLTLKKGEGITNVTGGGTYKYGEKVKINANVASKFVWSKWTGTNISTTQQYEFNMPAQNVVETANAICSETGGTKSTDVLNVVWSEGGMSHATETSFSEGVYTSNTVDGITNKVYGQLALDNNTVAGKLHVNVGDTIYLYAPSAGVEYTDTIGYAGAYSFSAAGGKGGDISAYDKNVGFGNAIGGYGSAITSAPISYAPKTSIKYQLGSNGSNQSFENYETWYYYSEDEIAAIVGRAGGATKDAGLYGSHNHSFCAYTVTSQVGTASYIQVSGNNYIVAGGGAPGAVEFAAQAQLGYYKEIQNGNHADITPTLPPGYIFYNPGATSMSTRYHDFVSPHVNANRIAGLAVKQGLNSSVGNFVVDMFAGWITTGPDSKISPIYPGYSGCGARDADNVFTPNNVVATTIDTSYTGSPYVKLKCNEKILTVVDPTREGYEFIGWECSTGSSVVSHTNNITTIKVTKSGSTITAKWKNLNPENVKLYAVNGTNSYVVTDKSASDTTVSTWVNTPYTLYAEATDSGDGIGKAVITRVDNGRNDVFDTKTYSVAIPALTQDNATFKPYSIDGTTSVYLTVTDKEGASNGRPLTGSTSTKKMNLKVDTKAPTATVSVSLGTYSNPLNKDSTKTWECWNVYNSAAYGAKISINLSDENEDAAGGKRDVSGLNRVWLTVYDTNNPENKQDIDLADGLNGAYTYNYNTVLNINNMFPNVMNLTYEVHATDMAGNEMSGIKTTSERKPEVYSKVERLTQDDDLNDSVLFKAGYRGRLYIYTTGWVDTLNLEWPDCIVKSGEYDVAHDEPGMIYNATLLTNGMYQGMQLSDDGTTRLLQETILKTEYTDENNPSSKAFSIDADGENTEFARCYVFDFWIPVYIGLPENPDHIDMGIVNQINTKITANKYLVKTSAESVTTETVTSTGSFDIKLGEGSIMDDFHSSIIN